MYSATNPFTFGALAMDDAFTDREDDVDELTSDIRNGQDVVVFAPRRYGKSSLVLKAAQGAIAEGTLLAYCDLMKTPTKERFAAALAKTIYEDLASPVGQALERAAALFRGLRVRPAMEIDPDAGLRFSFEAGRRGAAAIDDTIEKLLELPGKLAVERKRRAAIVFDEFQEVVKLDAGFPNLMRALFQTQPEVSHVYLGSKRHILERIFSDKNEPFWRSAKRMEIGMIATEKFALFIRQRFEDTGKRIDDECLERLLSVSKGHPYGTQELAYYLWELVPADQVAGTAEFEQALARVLRSERNHLSKIWDDATENERRVLLALAEEPAASLYSGDYHDRHDLPSRSHVQRAVGQLIKEEVLGRLTAGSYDIVEPFLVEWIEREQTDHGVTDELQRGARRRKRT